MLSHLGDLMFRQKAWDAMHQWACCNDGAANHQLPRAAAFWIISVVSVEECLCLTQNLMQIHCSAHSVILNVTATQYTCSLNGVYCPHWLVPGSRHCSCMHIPVHSPWPPDYINVSQSALEILTLVGVFPDRPKYHDYTKRTSSGMFQMLFKNLWTGCFK